MFPGIKKKTTNYQANLLSRWFIQVADHKPLLLKRLLLLYSTALVVSGQDGARMVCKAEEKSEIISEEVTEILNSSIGPNCYKG